MSQTSDGVGRNSAVPFEKVGRSRTPKKTTDERGAGIDVAPSYLAEIRLALKAKGWSSYREIEAATRGQIGKSTLARFFGSEDGSTPPQPTDVVARVLCTLVNLPYPMVAIESSAEDKWIRMSRQAKAIDPTFHDEVLASMEGIVSSHARKTSVTKRWSDRVNGLLKPKP